MWRTGIAIGVFAIPVMVVSERLWPGWGRPILITFAVLGYLLVDYRTLWPKTSYWLLMGVFGLVHLLLLAWLRDFINRFRLPATVGFALAEVFVFMMVLAFIASEEDLQR